MRISLARFLISCGLVCGFSQAGGAQEQLYDRFGRPIIGGRVYNAPPQQPYYPQQQYYPPQQQYYQQPGYSPYAPQRRSRYEQANQCVTDYGACQLPGPMFVGKGCSCRFAGVGKVGGWTVNQ
jgi:hypothetical protein